MDLRHVQRGKHFPFIFFYRFLSFNFHFMYFFFAHTHRFVHICPLQKLDALQMENKIKISTNDSIRGEKLCLVIVLDFYDFFYTQSLQIVTNDFVVRFFFRAVYPDKIKFFVNVGLVLSDSRRYMKSFI